MTTPRLPLLALTGMILGATLHLTGFSSFDAVHQMFVLDNLRLLFTFAGAVAILAPLLPLLTRNVQLTRKPFHPRVVIGSLIFGSGWALTGACPAVALVQLGEGKWPSLATMGGMIAGTFLFGFVNGRYLKWDSGSCDV